MKVEVRKPAPREEAGMRRWGTWGCEVSTFPYEYDERETCLIVEGSVRVEGRGKHAGLAPVEFGPGDVVVFPKGLQCTWIVKKPVRKHYRFG